MKNANIVLLIITKIVSCNSCKNFITNTDSLIDRIEDSKLNNPAQIPFLISGLKTKFSTAASHTFFLSDILSDLLYKYPHSISEMFSYDEIDYGIISLNNEGITDVYKKLSEVCFYKEMFSMAYTRGP